LSLPLPLAFGGCSRSPEMMLHELGKPLTACAFCGQPFTVRDNRVNAYRGNVPVDVELEGAALLALSR
jgi:hypothetical protein